MKAAIMILTHEGSKQRQERLQLCMNGLLNRHYGGEVEWDIHVFHSGGKDKDIVEGEPHFCHRLSNSVTLGQRHNLAMEVMMAYEWEYLVRLGSDDIIHRYTYIMMELYMMHGIKFGTWNRVAMVSPSMDKMKILHGQGAFGAGAFARRDVVDRCGDIWYPHQVKGMDGNFELAMTRAGAPPIIIDTPWPAVYDLKCDDNLHSYEKYEGREVVFRLDEVVV